MSLRLKLNSLTLWHSLACGLILLSFFLRVHQLNHVAVDKGEAMSINWFIRKGIPYLLTHNKDLNNHPLNSVLGYLTSLGHESIFTLRWHSVVIGVIGVAVIMRLARQLFGRRDGLVAGLLAGTSAYYVAFSQISRGYAGLVAFTALGFWFIYNAAQTGQKRYWVAFVLISILNIYNHLYGAMAVGVLALVAVILLLKRSMARSPLTGRGIISALAPWVVSLVLIFSLSLALYAPMLADTLAIVGQANQFRASDLRQAEGNSRLENLIQPVHEAVRPFSIAEDSTRLQLADPTIYYTPFDPLAVMAESAPGYYLALISCGLGLIFSWRKFRWPTLILLIWLATPFVVQLLGGLVLPGAYFRGRFVGFIYAPFLLLLARGWPALADAVQAWAGSRRVVSGLAGGLGWLGVGLLLMLNLAWLSAYYTAADQEHWTDIAQHIRRQWQERDVVMCGQRLKTACDTDLSVRLRAEVQNFDQLITYEQVQANRPFLEQPGRVWLVMPHLLPWQVARLSQKMAATHYGLLGEVEHGQAGWLLLEAQSTLGDNLAAALQLGADLSLNAQDKFNYYFSLTQLQLARNRLPEAEIAFAAATALLSEPDGANQKFAAVAERLQYARQAALPLKNLPSTAVPAHLNFADLARLVAYELDRQTISPGQPVQVKLYWQPLAHLQQNLVSYVHLTDRRANLIAQAGGVPAAGKAPTTSWQPNKIVVDSYTLNLPDTLQAPLVVQVEAGLYDPATYTFIKPLNANGQEIGSAITEMKITPTIWPMPEPTYPLRADFAGLISLIGYDLRADPPGMALYWQAKAPIDEDYTVFIHLLDANGKLIGQMDGQPVQGNYPTSWWSPDEVIVDQRTRPADMPGGRSLVVGWYRAADGSRLPLTSGAGDSVTLPLSQIP